MTIFIDPETKQHEIWKDQEHLVHNMRSKTGRRIWQKYEELGTDVFLFGFQMGRTERNVACNCFLPLDFEALKWDAGVVDRGLFFSP